LQIKGVFFDLGGTLFSYSGRIGGSAIGHVVSSVGIAAPGEEIGKAWRTASQQVGAEFHSRPYFLHKDLFQATLTTFLAAFGHQTSAGLEEEFHRQQRDEVVNNLPIREDCLRTLAALRASGLYLSIVSNIDDDYLDPLVDKHALGGVLDDWTSSEEARSCKPHAEIFHYCLRKSGLQPEEVLFVGDSLHHDVAGAAAVGMPSVRIVEEGVVTPLTEGLQVTADPTYEISTLTELVSLVAQHNNA
jgi:HAD superfamily hydrolase (TIGR01509 family)